jgi:hypothetical protein
VKLVEAEVELLTGGHHQRRQQAPTIGVEKPVQGSADLIVGQGLRLRGREAERPGCEGVHHLLLPVDGLAFGQDRAKQHCQPLRVGEPAARARRRDEAREVGLHPEALEKVIHERKRAQPLRHQVEGLRIHDRDLTRSRSCDNITARYGGCQVPKPQDLEDSSPTPPSPAIATIRRRIARMELVCSGTLLERLKTCGKSNCRCAKDPEARHGPYHEWTRREGGRLVHSSVSREQARQLQRAIRNHREILALLKRWERETAAIILNARSPNP